MTSPSTAAKPKQPELGQTCSKHTLLDFIRAFQIWHGQKAYNWFKRQGDEKKSIKFVCTYLVNEIKCVVFQSVLFLYCYAPQKKLTLPCCALGLSTIWQINTDQNKKKLKLLNLNFQLLKCYPKLPKLNCQGMIKSGS